MITPDDIATKTFKKVAAGYSPEEVDRFLDDIYEDYEILYHEHQELKKTGQKKVAPEKIQEEPKEEVAPDEFFNTYTEKMEKNKSVPNEINQLEKVLEKTLHLAEAAAQEIKDAAVIQGKQIVHEAKLQADEYLQSTRSKQYELEQTIIDLENRYQLMRTRVKLLLYAEIELLDKNEIISQKEEENE